MYAFQADTYCDSCGEMIAEDSSLIDTGDSDDFPQYAAAEETDGPNHCANRERCIEAIDLTEYGLRTTDVLIGAESRLIGAFTNDGLTEHGAEYLAEMLAEPEPTAYQRALFTLWRDEFGA